jgi:hypothetical protein
MAGGGARRVKSSRALGGEAKLQSEEKCIVMHGREEMDE